MRALILVKELFESRMIIYELAKSDFKNRYIGSYLGLAWAVIHPIMIVFLYYMVFTYGLRVQPVSDYPFILWFIAGIVPWFFFSDALGRTTTTFQTYSYIIKKVVFKASLLPIVSILSSFFVSIAFNIILLVIFVFSGYSPSVHIIDILYYNICMFYLLIGLSFIVSSIQVFFRDMGQIISIILQFGLWVTPILWNYEIIPEKYLWIFKLNPMFYICDGYRVALLHKVWFFYNNKQMIYFWVVSTLIFVFGAYVYKKLRPHFADVL